MVKILKKLKNFHGQPLVTLTRMTQSSFYEVFGYPNANANYGPLLQQQPHSCNVDSCIISSFTQTSLETS